MNDGFLSSLINFPCVSSVSEDCLDDMDAESDILTRVVIEKLSMTVNLGEGADVIITSETALINVHGISFEGDFSLTSSDNENIAAPTAIWPKDSDSIYFPDGYSLQMNGTSQEGEEAVFRIDPNGKLLQSNGQLPQDISSSDWLDEAEAQFNNIIFGEMMSYLPKVWNKGEMGSHPLSDQRGAQGPKEGGHHREGEGSDIED